LTNARAKSRPGTRMTATEEAGGPDELHTSPRCDCRPIGTIERLLNRGV